MTDAELALSILRKMAANPADWTIKRDNKRAGYCCIEANWFDTTPEEADLLQRLGAESGRG